VLSYFPFCWIGFVLVGHVGIILPLGFEERFLDDRQDAQKLKIEVIYPV